MGAWKAITVSLGEFGAKKRSCSQNTQPIARVGKPIARGD